MIEGLTGAKDGETRGSGYMAALLAKQALLGKDLQRELDKLTRDGLEEVRNFGACPAAGSGWPGHAECRGVRDRIDWLFDGVYIERDTAGKLAGHR